MGGFFVWIIILVTEHKTDWALFSASFAESKVESKLAVEPTPQKYHLNYHVLLNELNSNNALKQYDSPLRYREKA